MKSLTDFINEAKELNPGSTAESQLEFIQAHCQKKMYKAWEKGRTVSGTEAYLHVPAKELIDTIGYGGNDLDQISIYVEKGSLYYKFQTILGAEDMSKYKSFVRCYEQYPDDSAKSIKDFIAEYVAEVFKDIDSLKAYVDQNGKTE